MQSIAPTASDISSSRRALETTEASSNTTLGYPRPNAVNICSVTDIDWHLAPAMFDLLERHNNKFSRPLPRNEEFTWGLMGRNNGCLRYPGAVNIAAQKASGWNDEDSTQGSVTDIAGRKATLLNQPHRDVYYGDPPRIEGSTWGLLGRNNGYLRYPDAVNIAAQKASTWGDEDGTRGSVTDIAGRKATLLNRPRRDEYYGAPPRFAGSTWGLMGRNNGYLRYPDAVNIAAQKASAWGDEDNTQGSVTDIAGRKATLLNRPRMLGN